MLDRMTGPKLFSINFTMLQPQTTYDGYLLFNNNLSSGSTIDAISNVHSVLCQQTNRMGLLIRHHNYYNEMYSRTNRFKRSTFNRSTSADWLPELITLSRAVYRVELITVGSITNSQCELWIIKFTFGSFSDHSLRALFNVSNLLFSI